MPLKTIAMSFVATTIIAITPQAVSAGTNGSYNYVSMGDSVASGAGLGADRSKVCDRSNDAYPHIIANALRTDVKNVACSGAKVDEGIYRGQTRLNHRLTPQLDRAFSDGTPDLITATIGANDARWRNYIAKCSLSDCGTRTDRATAVAFRLDLRKELHYMVYQTYRLSSSNPPTILLSGYYNPIDSTECIEASGITTSEAKWLGDQVGYLNNTIKSVANRYSFVKYVPVDFTGHELCSSDSWVQSLSDDSPLHPTIEGQREIARAHIDVLRDTVFRN